MGGTTTLSGGHAADPENQKDEVAGSDDQDRTIIEDREYLRRLVRAHDVIQASSPTKIKKRGQDINHKYETIDCQSIESPIASGFRSSQKINSLLSTLRKDRVRRQNVDFTQLVSDPQLLKKID